MIADISEVLLLLGLSDSATDEQRAIANYAIRSAQGAVKRHLMYDPEYGQHTEYYPQQDFLVDDRQTVWEVNDENAYQRTRDAGLTDTLLVRHIPIRSIAFLYVDYDARHGQQSGSFGAETLKTEGTDYWTSDDLVDSDGVGVCRDGIIRSYGIWPATPGAVKIVYSAGYKSAEFRGEEAALDASPIWTSVVEEAMRMAKKLLVNKKSTRGFVAGPIVSESLGDYSYSVDGSALNRLYGSSWELTGESKDRLRDFINMGYALGG